MENPYHILGLSVAASDEEIKMAYRSQAMRHHPDRSDDPRAAIRFNAIKTAYELLSDPKKRADYNQSLSNRILIDPAAESLQLWHSLFARCGILLPDESLH